MSLFDIEQLRWQNAVLREKNWATNERKLKQSRWFFLVSTRYKPTSEIDREQKKQYCDEIMQEFKDEIGQIVTINRKTHSWTPDYINDVVIRYVVETGRGKLKLDGTRGKSGGQMHIHVDVSIYHHSNISLTYEALYAFFQPRIWRYFGIEKPFVSRPRLIPADRVKEYMEKSFENAVWTTVL